MNVSKKNSKIRSERGSTAVEFGLVAVALMSLVFGLIEGGLIVRAKNAVANSANEAARRGAIATNAANADYKILQTIKQRGALDLADIEYVVVYRAVHPSATPSSNCASGIAEAGKCNVYHLDDFNVGEAAFNCSDANLDASWCPSTRGGSDFEYVGVAVKAKHRGFTGFMGNSMDLSAYAGQLIE